MEGYLRKKEIKLSKIKIPKNKKLSNIVKITKGIESYSLTQSKFCNPFIFATQCRGPYFKL